MEYIAGEKQCSVIPDLQTFPETNVFLRLTNMCGVAEL